MAGKPEYDLVRTIPVWAAQDAVGDRSCLYGSEPTQDKNGFYSGPDSLVFFAWPYIEQIFEGVGPGDCRKIIVRISRREKSNEQA